MAVDLGLLTADDDSTDPMLRRTAFGDLWSSKYESTGGTPGAQRLWPLQGPGIFDLEFYPLTKRPMFPVFALTGPMVTAVRQGGWNLKRGFGHPAPMCLWSRPPMSDLPCLRCS